MKFLTLALCLAIVITDLASAKPVQSPVSLVVVEKAKRSLTLYSGKRIIKTYRIALGGNPVGHKQQEGDLRTPEGRYTIDGKNPGSSFHLSLHISYPDRHDRTTARRNRVSPGGAIMIHGSPAYLAVLNAAGFYVDWTAGCIAVTNEEIEEIYAKVRTGTPIIIKP